MNTYNSKLVLDYACVRQEIKNEYINGASIKKRYSTSVM